MRVACRSIALGLLVVRKRNIMRELSNSIETSQRSGKLKKSGVVPQPFTWSMTATADPHQAHNFETLLLAIAGHDLRQPLQILQSANELLRLGPRTNPSCGFFGPVKMRLTG